nr:hypothetical protein [uncultured Blautia sp.]
MERKTIKTDNSNNKVQFTKTSTTITPDDGFVNERKLGHIGHFGESNYIKGHAKSVSFSTDDPRVTKPFLYIMIIIFIVIGLILLFTDAWFIGIAFLVMTFLTYRSNIKSIREKEIEYTNKGKDTTIDSLNEAKEIFSELNEEIKDSFRESAEYIKEHKK